MDAFYPLKAKNNKGGTFLLTVGSAQSGGQCAPCSTFAAQETTNWLGLILAADNAVALDAVVARMMDVDPARLRFLQKAKTFGLGDFDSRMIHIEGEMQILASSFRLYVARPLRATRRFSN